jgi:hypothetical protein
MAVCEWLQMQEPNFYHNRIFKLVPRWVKCINMLMDNVGGINELHLML